MVAIKIMLVMVVVSLLASHQIGLFWGAIIHVLGYHFGTPE